MNELTTMGDERKPAPEWRTVAVGLAVAGVVVSLISGFALAMIWRPLGQAVGLAITVAGLLLFVLRARDEAARLVEGVSEDLRRLAVGVERSTSRFDNLKQDFAALVVTVDNERRNLGLVAGGLGEMRQLVRLERQNLGLVANGVDEIRTALTTVYDAVQSAHDEVERALSRLDDAAVQTRLLESRYLDLQDQVQVERHNLGLVAGALDDVRRSTAGAHLFDARQAAFEDELVRVADRIDELEGTRPEVASSTLATDGEQWPGVPGDDA